MTCTASPDRLIACDVLVLIYRLAALLERLYFQNMAWQACQGIHRVRLNHTHRFAVVTSRGANCSRHRTTTLQDLKPRDVACFASHRDWGSLYCWRCFDHASGMGGFHLGRCFHHKAHAGWVITLGLANYLTSQHDIWRVPKNHRGWGFRRFEPFTCRPSYNDDNNHGCKENDKALRGPRRGPPLLFPPHRWRPWSRRVCCRAT